MEKLTFSSSSSSSSSALGKKDRLYRYRSNQPLVSGSTSCIAYYNQLAIDYLPSTTRNAVFQGCNPPHFFIHQTTIASRGWLCNRLMSSRILPPVFFLSPFFTFNKRFSNIFHFDIFYFSISNKNVFVRENYSLLHSSFLE